MLFEHGLKLENISNEPWDLHDVIYRKHCGSVIISPMFLFAKTLLTAMTL